MILFVYSMNFILKTQSVFILLLITKISVTKRRKDLYNNHLTPKLSTKSTIVHIKSTKV